MLNTGRMMMWLVVVATVLAASTAEGDDGEPSRQLNYTRAGPVVVETLQGAVEGIQEISTKGRRFYAYYSIPFAKPPVKELRFKDPVKAPPWEGVLEGGSSYPPPCLQVPFSTIATGVISLIGQEDCLYLNVFTSKPRQTEAELPVLVFIHGGAYFAGSASKYPPHALLNEDIVLVTLQYRLGVLGFLSTEDEVMPGNLALKDQVMALQWVKANIRQFGGDPKKVTIFGESAGAAFVHFHILSPKSDGLFSRAILQSGSALCPWSLGASHREVAFHTADTVGCADTRDSYELLRCLQEARAEQLVLTLLDHFAWQFLPLLLGPRVDGDVIPMEPEVLARLGYHKHIDIISGITAHDGGLLAVTMYAREDLRKALQERFHELGPVALSFDTADDTPLLLARQVFNHYLGGVHLDEAHAEQVVKMFTDRTFAVCHDLTSILHSRSSAGPLPHHHSKAPHRKDHHIKDHHRRTYTYELHYRGEHSITDIFNITIGRHWVTHADDLFYFFTGGEAWLPLTRPQDLAFRDLLIRLWVNFATTGNPTPDFSLGFTWEPTTEAHLQHLVLQPSPVMHNDTRRQEREFLTSLPTYQYGLLEKEMEEETAEENGWKLDDDEEEEVEENEWWYLDYDNDEEEIEEEWWKLNREEEEEDERAANTTTNTESNTIYTRDEL
ncbi:carboxylic ester hydrolase-like isoform X1 [Procambarus clarkii]|uniref:carboxylic ester hydrolase-like isoform X1 n=2 Tax=Procambarus clarkii TaxID=6728 RepID=UPI003742834E